jgi:hypothetical protein
MVYAPAGMRPKSIDSCRRIAGPVTALSALTVTGPTPSPNNRRSPDSLLDTVMRVFTVPASSPQTS